jgi:hypothetical protein
MMQNKVSASELGDSKGLTKSNLIFLAFIEVLLEAELESIFFYFKVLDGPIKPAVVGYLEAFDEELLCLIRKIWRTANILSVFVFLKGDIGAHEAFVDAMVKVIFRFEFARPLYLSS